MLGDLPLLAYRIKSALRIADAKDVWISTDSKKYAEIAKSYGATVPFLRPVELATDTASSVDVVLHAMRWAEKQGLNYETIGLLEPTSPFITYKHLAQAAELLFAEEEASGVVAVRQVRPSTFYVQNEEKYLRVVAENIRLKGVLRRQDEHIEVTPSGGFYIAKWAEFKQTKTFYTSHTLSFRVPDVNGLEIDEPLDWYWAEFLIEKKIIKVDDLFGEEYSV